MEKVNTLFECLLQHPTDQRCNLQLLDEVVKVDGERFPILQQKGAIIENNLRVTKFIEEADSDQLFALGLIHQNSFQYSLASNYFDRVTSKRKPYAASRAGTCIACNGGASEYIDTKFNILANHVLMKYPEQSQVPSELSDISMTLDYLRGIFDKSVDHQEIAPTVQNYVVPNSVLKAYYTFPVGFASFYDRSAFIIQLGAVTREIESFYFAQKATFFSSFSESLSIVKEIENNYSKNEDLYYEKGLLLGDGNTVLDAFTALCRYNNFAASKFYSQSVAIVLSQRLYELVSPIAKLLNIDTTKWVKTNNHTTLSVDKAYFSVWAPWTDRGFVTYHYYFPSASNLRQIQGELNLHNDQAVIVILARPGNTFDEASQLKILFDEELSASYETRIVSESTPLEQIRDSFSRAYLVVSLNDGLLGYLPMSRAGTKVLHIPNTACIYEHAFTSNLAAALNIEYYLATSFIKLPSEELEVDVIYESALNDLI